MTLRTPRLGSAPRVSPLGPQLIQSSIILAIPVNSRPFMWRCVALCAHACAIPTQASFKQLSRIVCNYCPSVGIFQGARVPFRGGSGVQGTSWELSGICLCCVQLLAFYGVPGLFSRNLLSQALFRHLCTFGRHLWRACWCVMHASSIRLSGQVQEVSRCDIWVSEAHSGPPPGIFGSFVAIRGQFAIYAPFGNVPTFSAKVQNSQALSAMTNFRHTATWGNIQAFSVIFGVSCQPSGLLQHHFIFCFRQFLSTTRLAAI